DLPRRIAHLLDRARLRALQPMLGLRAFELRPGVVRLIGGLADRVRHAQADAPRREVAPEQLSEHRSERRLRARPDNRAGEPAGAQHLRAAETAGLIAGVDA